MRQQMQHHTSIADLLKLVLGLDAALPVHGTQGFRRWDTSMPAWPPAPDASGGLWLVDTRDKPDLAVLARGAEEARFDAALVLSRGRHGRRSARRRLRQLLQRIPRRIPEGRVAAILAGLTTRVVHSIGFTDDGGLPTDFDLNVPEGSSGTAFLVTTAGLPAGRIWAAVEENAGNGPLEILSFQLRARGAAVVIVRAAGRRFVVRLVPAGPLQAVVLKNHSALSELRRALRERNGPLNVIPEPLLAEHVGPTAVLVETCLNGQLAWELARGPLAPTIHDNAVSFLHALRQATYRPASGPAVLTRLLRNEEERIATASSFTGERMREMIGIEMRNAAAMLSRLGVEAYTSHGDFSYGNILVDSASGALEGVIDWDTSRALDVPGIDRVNLEIQILRTTTRVTFPAAVEAVWRGDLTGDALRGEAGADRARALFGLGVCRFITRAMGYPHLYSPMAGEFERAMAWLLTIRA